MRLTLQNAIVIRSPQVAGLLFATIVVCSLPELARADPGQNHEFFEKKIRPVLIQSCYKCHSAQADEVQGGLRLDSREGIRGGGDSGPAVVPGQPDESLLIEAIRHESFEMPPKAKLPDEVIADFVKWIQLGAPDPRDKPDGDDIKGSWDAILAARRDWWSLKPVTPVDPPTVDSAWPRGNIDRFIVAKLQEAGLKPAAAADPRTLIRRLTLVLTGLPPGPDDVVAFVRDFEENPDATYRQLVDRLLASPHFGERWARHWMDVVRFTETHGNEWNYEVHHAWRYRDYLIRAFNSDVPYDQFVREHIAGDLLASPRWNDELKINESLIGTSFYRFGEVNHDDCVSLTSIGYDILDNQIDTLTKAFQATTVACARCHDHKMDAVSTNDYYALLGILKSSRLTAHTIDAPEVNAAPLQRLAELKPQIRNELVRHWQAQTEDITGYLIAAQAKIAQSPQADELTAKLDPARLDAWVKALSVETPPEEHPAHPWQSVAAAEDVAAKWQEISAAYETHRRDNETFNAQQFTTIADFRATSPANWTSSGQGLRDDISPSGEFTIAHEGDRVVKTILPAGRYTHVWSEKLNGTLRSPVIAAGKKRISLQVLGDKTSAVRLVSNNCQLNYANYRALTSPEPTWVTFEIPDEAKLLRTFAELVTKFDNPKFPDQLGTLGGDKTNDRIPWSEAAADPRSYFGIMRAVVHDGSEPPKPNLTPIMRLFEDGTPVTNTADVAARYAPAIRTAVDAWATGDPTDEDVTWLSWVVQNDLLDHRAQASPRLAALVDEYRRIENRDLQQPRLAAGMGDFDAGADHPVLLRGNYESPGDVVRRRYLEVLSPAPQPAFTTGSGRRELAEAIAARDNPLTSRVIVNRVWHHLFGTGIVRTVDDFGHVGEYPSHPHLLDHLAARFAAPVDDGRGGMGWSLKTLIREIVLSQTFRTASIPDSESRQVDPQNRLLGHYPVRRMEAEAIRDSILAISGRLQPTMYGQSIQPFREESNEIRRLFAGPLDGDGRRSVYIKVNLMEGPKFLEAFNVPGGKITQGRRDVTNVPAQALTLLNDSFVIQQAGVWADALIAQEDESTAERLDGMFHRALGRPATAAEIDRFSALIADLARLRQVPPEKIPTEKAIWQDVAHVLFNSKELIYIP